MHRTLWTLSLVALVFVLAPACERSKPERRPSPVRIGVMLPLTGGAASLGQSCRRGVELAIEQYSQDKIAGQPDIVLVTEDTQAKPAQGISAFHKLTDADKVHAIIGPLASGVTIAVAPLTERAHTVILSPGASTPSISAAGEFVFRNELSEALGARRQAELAYQTLGYRKIALIYVNNEYGVGTATQFRSRFTELGGSVPVDEAFTPAATNFRTVLTKLKNSAADAVFFVYQDSVLDFMRQRAELGVATQVFTTPVFEDPSNLKNLGHLAEGVVYAYYGDFDPQSKDDLRRQFVVAYTTRYDETPTYYSALGYDAARILLKALSNCSFKRTSVAEALYSIKDFPGVTGITTFDSNGDVNKPVTLRTVRSGAFVKYKDIP